MAAALDLWVAGERYEIMQDIKWFDAGAKLLSPSGKDITHNKVQKLNERLRELKDALRENGDA